VKVAQVKTQSMKHPKLLVIS